MLPQHAPAASPSPTYPLIGLPVPCSSFYAPSGASSRAPHPTPHQLGARTMQATASVRAQFVAARPAARTSVRRSVAAPVRAAAAQGEMVNDMGFKLMRKGVKEAAKETILTPRCAGGCQAVAQGAGFVAVAHGVW